LQRYIAKGPAESVKQARRVADRTSATGGQARDGLSAGLIGSGERPKSDFCYFHPSQNTWLDLGRNQMREKRLPPRLFPGKTVQIIPPLSRLPMNNTIYFLHGLDSSGSGTKGHFFARNFPHVVCPDFAGTLAERLDQLAKLCQNEQQLILIGSSFGGLMATCFATQHHTKIKKLILLAPALNFEGYRPPAKKLSTPAYLLVGKYDTVTPADLVVPLAEATFTNLESHIAEDDHMLHNTFQLLHWDKLIAG
jgi:pimeloyl-ACP methyl ester carboxylesterase